MECVSFGGSLFLSVETLQPGPRSWAGWNSLAYSRGVRAGPPQGTWRQRVSEKLGWAWALGGQFEEVRRERGSPQWSAVGRGQFSGGDPLSLICRGSSTG